MPRLRPVLAVLALLAWTSCDELPSAYTASGAVVYAPTYEARIDTAVERSGRVSLSFGGADKVGKVGKMVAVDAPTFGGLPDDAKTVDVLQDPDLREALLGKDEAVAAELLRKRGVKVLLLHHGATPSVDRGGRVFSRLYHHDHLEHFALFRVSDTVLYYEVLDRPLIFPPQLAGASIAYLRARLKGAPPRPFPEIQPEEGQKEWKLMATLRAPGSTELAVAVAQNKTYQGALEELREDLERDHRRNVELEGHPPINEDIDNLEVEIHRIVERAYVESRSDTFLKDYWEMGIDGAYLMNAEMKERGALPGAAAFTRSIRDPDRLLRHAAKMGTMSEKRPWRDKDAWLESMRTIHYREHGEGSLSYLYRGVQPVPMERFSLEATRLGIVAAGDWYLNNLGANGQIIYKFWPSENRYSNEYNLVRHTLGTWNLVQAWEMDPSRTDFLQGSRLALDFTQTYLEREPVPGGDGEQMAYYSFNNNQKLGTVVVNLLGMIDLARATDDHQWDEQLEEMGRFVLYMQNDAGTFDGYYVDEDHPYYKQSNDIVPGEAALSLVYLAEYFDDDSWIATLPEYWAYYDDGGWFRDRVEQANPEAPWPAYTYENQTRLDLVQFGPWTVMAANAYHRRTGDQKVAEFGLEIARWMIEAYEYTEDNAPFPDYIGGYYKLPYELPAMQAFCYAEGTAAAYGLALRAKPEEAAFFEQHTRETVRIGLQMQYDELSTYAFSRPLQVDGGIRYALNETKVRVDYVHHGLSAMYQYYKAAKSDPDLAESIRDGEALPSQLLRIERRAEALAEAEASGEEPPQTVGRLPYPVPVKPLQGIKDLPSVSTDEEGEEDGE